MDKDEDADEDGQVEKDLRDGSHACSEPLGAHERVKQVRNQTQADDQSDDVFCHATSSRVGGACAVALTPSLADVDDFLTRTD